MISHGVGVSIAGGGVDEKDGSCVRIFILFFISYICC